MLQFVRLDLQETLKGSIFLPPLIKITPSRIDTILVIL